MQLTQLTVVFSVLSTVYALQNFPWVFFVYTYYKFIPLSGMYLGDDFRRMSIFTYGDELGKPVEFTFEDGKAHALHENYWQFVGFYGGEFVFGPQVKDAALRLDKKFRLLDGPFYSCGLVGGPARGIYREIPATGVTICFEVQIYILPYDRETKSALPPVN